MDFDPSAVEIFSSELSGKTKYRVCVGFVVSKGLYCMQRFGLLDSEPGMVHPIQKHMKACRRTYDEIEVPGELIIPIFGYHLGEPCQWDFDGLPIGDWPQLGEARITYTDKFMMPGAKLPGGYELLRPMRWSEPSWTGGWNHG